ncbi:hypothetical protein E0493_12865 [Roseomonas sp. M0104]|uniref:Lipoprotein n=2 Tax=Teichococcus coralli TaxID=2545983 RepID=A0A845BDN8_9PROT|nr:hypothetical protein [Pseudoroseomonas coralli]
MTRRGLAGFLGLLGVAGLGLAGCARTAPIYNVSHADFVGSAPLAVRSEQIRRAGAGLGWIMEDEAPGVIRGTLNLRTHQAVVQITYTPTDFSLRYVDSTNLNYDGAMIHRNYNGWIQRLEQHIIAQSAV